MRALNGIFVDHKGLVSNEIPKCVIIVGVFAEILKKKKCLIYSILFFFFPFAFLNVHRRNNLLWFLPLFLKKRKRNDVRGDESHVFLVIDSLHSFKNSCPVTVFRMRQIPFLILVTTSDFICH